MNIAFDRPPAAIGSTVWARFGQSPIHASRQSAAAEWFEKTGLPSTGIADAAGPEASVGAGIAGSASQSAEAAAAFTRAR
jgi:hypothetical protein